ncbi:MAG: sodium:proton exchanger, partial [Magnetococcales bacterium]|nr:sodium:proton exchanger [Magnetococcales bacterium]
MAVKAFLAGSIDRFDFIAWALTLLFFIGSAFLFSGDPLTAALGWVGVVI